MNKPESMTSKMKMAEEMQHNRHGNLAKQKSEFSNDERALISQWTFGSDEYWRKLTENGRAPKGSDAAKFDNYLASNSEGGTLYRGVRVGGRDFDDLTQDSIGTLIDQKGISSWSTESMSAESFATPSTWNEGVIFVMNGTNKGKFIAPVSEYPGEYEVAVSSKSRQEITGVKKKGQYWYINVEEVA